MTQHEPASEPQPVTPARATEMPLSDRIADYLSMRSGATPYEIGIGIRTRRSAIERTLRSDRRFMRQPGGRGRWTLAGKLRDDLQAAESPHPTVHTPPRELDERNA